MVSTEGGLQLYSSLDSLVVKGRVFPTLCSVPAHLQSVMLFYLQKLTRNTCHNPALLVCFMGVLLWPCQGWGGGSAGGGFPSSLSPHGAFQHLQKHVVCPWGVSHLTRPGGFLNHVCSDVLSQDSLCLSTGPLCSSQSLGAVSVLTQNRDRSVLRTPCVEAEQQRVAGPWWPWCHRAPRPGNNPGLSN